MTNLVFDSQSHIYTHNGNIVPSVTQILHGIGEYSFLKKANERNVAIACDRGTIVHEIIQMYDCGQLSIKSVDSRLKGYLNAYKKLKLPKCIESELMVYNSQLNYAGTLDQLRDNWICDLKSGIPDPVHELQLIAYVMAYCDNNHELARQFRLSGIYLAEDGSGKVIDYKYNVPAWHGAINYYNWRKLHRKAK